MSIEASPPAQPPQMSPDKQWFWDGAQWRPIPHHEAAFPSWKSLGEGFIPPAAAAPAAPAFQTPPPAARRARSPQQPSYRIAGPAPDVAAPLWNRGPAPTGIKKYANIAAGAVAIVVVAILASLFIPPIVSSRQPVSTSTPAPTPAPGPKTRSDASRVAYLLGILDAPMADLKDDNTAIKVCGTGMTTSCQDALTAIANTMGNTLPSVEKAPIPSCVTAAFATVRSDLTTIDTGAQQALKGVRDNRKAEFTPGVSQAYYALIAVQTDYARMKATAAGCSSDVTGP